MNRKELDKIIDNLDTVFRGDAWHGPSVMEFINSMPLNVVDERKEYSKYSICQIIYHLGAWRRFVLEKIGGNIRYDLVSEEENYGTEEAITKQNWPNLVEQLRANQEELISTLESLDDDLLVKLVPGQDYTYYKLLTGLIQHDTYHLGMIWVLWE
ncbi:DinB family protein [Emticicia soli]|uniref:DinB family protein n=1 Tax=Emticicia soli TaxID=2027878 RepID=A0ABW5J682_9BACT